MSWVDSHYISVDNDGILTFKAPPSAVVPAAPAPTVPAKTGGGKKSSKVPLVTTMIANYMKYFGGGSAAALHRRIYEASTAMSKSFTHKLEKTAYDALTNYLKNWFDDERHRGTIPDDGTWNQEYIPNIGVIQESLGKYLPKGVQWATILKHETVAPKPQKERAPQAFTTMERLANRYEEIFKTVWSSEDQTKWENGETVNAPDDVSSLMRIMFQIRAILVQQKKTEQSPDTSNPLHESIINLANETNHQIDDLSEYEEIDDITLGMRQKIPNVVEAVREMIAYLKSKAINVELHRIIQMSNNIIEQLKKNE